MAEASTSSVSLLDEFKRGTAFEAALISTYNVYFPFLEELVLRRLRTLGCSFVVALADAGQVSAEIIDVNRRPRLAGRRYALLPVPGTGAFHPKIGLFLGPRSARVIVGSHNLTMSGFGLNREVTNVIDVQGKKDREGAAAVQEILDFSREWAARMSPALNKSLEDLAAFARPYQGPVPANRSITVVGSRPEGESLWERVLPLLPKSVDRITVIGPFFDNQLAFLERVGNDLQPKELVVGIDPSTVSFPREASIKDGVRLVDASGLSPGKNGEGYLHAKAILIESGTERCLISGSANPTVAAWLAGPTARNAEVVVVRQLGDEDYDLGLAALAARQEVSATSIEVVCPREEPSSRSEAASRLLVGVSSEGLIAIERPPTGVEMVEVSSAEGDPLPVSFEAEEGQLMLRGAKLEEAAHFQLSAGGVVYHGWVHHVDALRQMALSSSQRRLRDALGGLSGDPTRLEHLLKMIEKVVFQGPSSDGRSKSAGKRDSGGGEQHDDESVVVIVPTLRDDSAEGLRRLSSGDLGLLLDVLMRQLWRSLTHEESTSTRSEGELIGSDDEDLVAELPTDPRVAALWRKKTATLLRRLLRRVKEGEDKAQVVVECAAVLGVLEAVRRVEDHDRWKNLNEEFLDRSLAKKFLIEAVPLLLLPENGVLDCAVAEVGEDFAEKEAVLQWLIWLAWTVGYGPAELLAELGTSKDSSDSIEGIARMGMIAARVAAWPLESARALEQLEATPRAGIRPDTWLEDLRVIGRTIVDPANASRAHTPPKRGDLVLLSLAGKGPMFVREVRGNKLELVDFTKPDAKLVILADRAEVLEPFGEGLSEQRA